MTTHTLPTLLTTQEDTQIEAVLRWNETNMILEAGREYEFSALGTWHDASIPCDANGYPPPALTPLQRVILKAFEPLRRVRSAPWFTLIGCIDKDMSTAFVIGCHNTIIAPKTGALTCFANDVSFMYGNNSGSVTLTVTPK